MSGAEGQSVDDLGASELARDPYPAYCRWREQAPVLQLAWDGTPIWAVTRHAAVLQAMREPLLGREAEGMLDPEAAPPHLRRFDELLVRRSMVFRDGEAHTRLRKLGRAALRGLGDAQQEALRARSVDVPLAAEMDLVRDFARPAVTAALAELLGVRDALGERFGQLVDALSVPEPDHRSVQAFEVCERAFRDGLERRRTVPGADLLTALVQEQERSALPDDDLLATCFVLLQAGRDTTAHLIASAMHLLLDHPALLERARGEPAFLALAIEETLRCESPVQVSFRVARVPVRLGGQTIPEGESVALLLGCANRDAERFRAPERFDPEREDLQHHVAFGPGRRRCLGEHVARAIAQAALAALLERAGVVARTAPAEWGRELAMRGLVTLPVRLALAR